jgi:hypothetical protein
MEDAAWAGQVRAAAASGDAAQLRGLFTSAVEAWGSEIASRRWQEILSAFDAAAITG